MTARSALLLSGAATAMLLPLWPAYPASAMINWPYTSATIPNAPSAPKLVRYVREADWCRGKIRAMNPPRAIYDTHSYKRDLFPGSTGAGYIERYELIYRKPGSSIWQRASTDDIRFSKKAEPGIYKYKVRVQLYAEDDGIRPTVTQWSAWSQSSSIRITKKFIQRKAWINYCNA